MCTGPGRSSCPPEDLAWQLYEEYGYRPVELRPCMIPSQSVGLSADTGTSATLVSTWLRQRRFRRRREGHKPVA